MIAIKPVARIVHQLGSENDTQLSTPQGNEVAPAGRKKFEMILLMAEILHHLGCMKPYK